MRVDGESYGRQDAWNAGSVTDEPLFGALSHLAVLLEDHGEYGWSNWVSTDLQRLLSGDAYALDHPLSAFGSTGSLSDLVLHPGDVHIGLANIEAANEQLNALRGKVWSEATRLRRSLD